VVDGQGEEAPAAAPGPAAAAAPPPPPAKQPAVQLFSGSILRRSWFQLVGALDGANSGETRWSYIGYGRIGAHLWLDDHHEVAIPIGLDAGGGTNVRAHARINLGLRYSPIPRLSIGLFPFTPSFAYYKEDSELKGAMRWTFPTTVEVGFSY
jgi:hypothetical protein